MTEQEYVAISEGITPLLGKMLEGMIRRNEPDSLADFKEVYPQLMGLVDGFIVKYCESLSDEVAVLEMIFSLLKFGADMETLREQVTSSD